jgi:hypothetical protein
MSLPERHARRWLPCVVKPFARKGQLAGRLSCLGDDLETPILSQKTKGTLYKHSIFVSTHTLVDRLRGVAYHPVKAIIDAQAVRD